MQIVAMIVFLICTPLVIASSAGAPAGVSGAPGESTCVTCHTGGAVNSGPGRVRIVTESSTYAPGQKNRLTVAIEDPNARAWGFLLSARNDAGASAGVFASVDTFTEAFRESQRQWSTHTVAGLRRNTTGNVTFQIDWTPPEASGPVVFYVAANAANANGQPTGDRIYTATLSLRPAEATSAAPVFSESDVREAFTARTGFGVGTWTTITGQNFAPSEQHWSPVGGRPLPTKLGGVSVKVNDVATPISSVSPTKVTFLVPANVADGVATVVVESGAGQSLPTRLTPVAVLPALVSSADPTVEGKLFASVTAANAGPVWAVPFARGWVLGNSGADSRAARGVHPGEEVDLWATGLGAVDDAGTVSSPVKVKLGDRALDRLSASMVSPGLYVVRVRVPEDTAAGDHALVIEMADSVSPPALLRVQSE